MAKCLRGAFIAAFVGVLAWNLLISVFGQEKTGYVNRQGKFVIAPVYDWGKPFKDGVAEVHLWPFEANGTIRKKFINTQGKVVLPDESIPSRVDNPEGWLDPNLQETEYQHFADKSEKSELEVISNGEHGNPVYGYRNPETKKIVISLQFREAGNFKDGLAFVAVGNSLRWGIINIKGEYVLRPICLYISEFHNDLALCRVKTVGGLFSIPVPGFTF